jgi:hypothetical protein
VLQLLELEDETGAPEAEVGRARLHDRGDAQVRPDQVVGGLDAVRVDRVMLGRVVLAQRSSHTLRMSACVFAALARMANEIASRSSSSVAPLCLAPARSRFAQWVLPAARFAAR